MRIGLVCPYSFDVPGGVQFHVRDLAEHLLGRGHQVRVLAPADEDTPVPDYLDSAGRAVPVKYNGSVARVNFGPVTAGRVHRWLAEGNFDVVHLHEPITPSVSLLTLWAATGPVVATFHTSTPRSRAMQMAYPMVRPSLERIAARIAVSEDARRTVVEHVGGDAVVIPNGVYVDAFAQATPEPEWQGTAQAPTIGFVGRLDEPRKGLQVLVDAMPSILAQHPQTRVAVIGPGEGEEALAGASDDVRAALHLLGPVSDERKASILASVDLFAAPHLGGESFGIVLIEALAAGAPVVASDLGAFRRVLAQGELGEIFPAGEAQALADTVTGLLRDPARRAQLRERGQVSVQAYDWSNVASRVLDVYETVREGDARVTLKEQGLLERWRS